MKLPLVDHEGERVVFVGPCAGYRMLAESRDCRVCNQRVQPSRVGVLMWFHKRCSRLLKIE